MFFSPEDGGGTGNSSSIAPAGAPTAPSPTTSVPGGESAGGIVESSAEASIIGDGAPGGVSYVKGDGSFEADWQNRLPEDFAPARDSLKNFKNVNELAKAYYSTKQLVGRKGVILPTPESSQEEVAAFRKELGVPDKIEGYAEVTKPTELPEGIQWNDEIAKSYYEVAHRHNVSAAAMKDLIALNMKQREFELQAQNESILETKQSGLAHLRRTWGTNFDRNLGIAQRAAQLAGVDANSYGWRDPEVVKGFVRIASMMGEDKLVSPGGTLPAGSADLKSRALDIIGNRANPLYEKYHNGDRETQQLVRRYLEQSSGGK